MIKRLIIAILLSPVWLLLCIAITAMYAVGYIKGSPSVTDMNSLTNSTLKHDAIKWTVDTTHN
jgi:hypothetical protein